MPAASAGPRPDIELIARPAGQRQLAEEGGRSTTFGILPDTERG